MESFHADIQLPESIVGVNFDSMPARFDEKTKVLSFEVDKLEQPVTWKCTLRYATDPKTQQPDVPWEELSCARVNFQLKGAAMTGIRLDSLDVGAVSYTPYKACRYTSKSGNCEIRCHTKRANQ